MKNVKSIFLMVFAFVLPLTLWGLSPSPGYSAQTSVSSAPTVKVAQSSETAAIPVTVEALPFMADYSAASFSNIVLKNQNISVDRSVHNQRPRYLAKADSWRFKQRDFVQPIYKPQNAGYESKSLTNLNKSSPLRR